MDPREDDGMMIDGIRIPPGVFDFPRPPPGFAASVLGDTIGALRARRRRRRVLFASCLAVLYGAGIATGLALRPPAAPPVKAPPAREGPPAAATPLDVVRAEAGGAPAGSLDPFDLLSRVPIAPAADSPRLLREAGDRWLALGDLEKALDCYRQVLEISPAGARRSPEPGESWLLVSLRNGL